MTYIFHQPVKKPRIIAAVESYATLGEIADAMRRVFGEYQDAS